MDYLSLTIAAIGAVTGIAALITQVWTYSLAGPRIRVSLTNSLPVYEEGPSRWVLGIDASNIGRLPVTITSFGVTIHRDGKWMNVPGIHPQEALLYGPRGA